MSRNLLGFVLLLMLSGCTTGAHIDHIMLGVRNLNEGIEEFQRLTGVEPQRASQKRCEAQP